MFLSCHLGLRREGEVLTPGAGTGERGQTRVKGRQEGVGVVRGGGRSAGGKGKKRCPLLFLQGTMDDGGNRTKPFAAGPETAMWTMRSSQCRCAGSSVRDHEGTPRTDRQTDRRSHLSAALHQRWELPPPFGKLITTRNHAEQIIYLVHLREYSLITSS